MKETSFNLRRLQKSDVKKLELVELYTILFIPDGAGKFQIDGGAYTYSGPTILFLSPFQKVQLLTPVKEATLLEFHGDFYCIEFHKTEVACNGLLFNNVFLSPYMELSSPETRQIQELLSRVNDELKDAKSQDRSVLVAYLQLFLAITSRMKKKRLNKSGSEIELDSKMVTFKKLIDEHFLELQRPADYAKLLKISADDLSRRCRKVFSKTPSQLINERVILEAKKKLHLTRLSVKEVAFELNFKDEHYFSRYFKKLVGVSPVKFRNTVGISIVADLSME